MKRMFCWLVGTMAALGACAELETTVASTTLKVAFDPSRRGAVVSARGTDGREFASLLDVRPLFAVVCRRADALTNVVETSANQAKAFRAERVENGLRLVYEDLGAAVARAVCTVRALPGDPAIRWRIALTPKDGWAVTKADYPQFAMTERLGETPVDDAVVIGSSRGGLCRFPMDPKREWWKNRLHGHFPYNLVMQFGCYYDDRGGLYTAAEDGQGNTKDLLLDRWYAQKRPDGTYGGGEFLLRWTRYGFATATEEQDYDIVTRAFAGADGEPTTWYDAADIYRAWSDRQFWRRTRFLDKKAVPAWAKDAPAMIQFNREWFDRPQVLRRWLQEYWLRKFPDVPLLVHTEGWEQHGEWVGADYFPCYPSDELHVQFNQWIKAAHGHPYPWPSGHNWNFQVGKLADGGYRLDFSQDFLARGAAHAACRPDGTVHYTSPEWLGGGSTAAMCPGDPWTIDWWNGICRELVKRGADYVQADQDNGARVRECWSTKHGHPPGPGRWETQAMRHQFETMLAEMRKIDPWAQFSFEDMNEFYADILCFVDYRDCRYLGSEWASVWNYLFHEYTPPFQSGVELHAQPHWLAHCVVDGQMPRLPMRIADYGFSVGALENGDFERLSPDGKSFLDWGRPQSQAISKDAASGIHSLKVESLGKRSQVSRSVYGSAFRLAKGATYRVTAKMKTLAGHPQNALTVALMTRDPATGREKPHAGARLAAPKAGVGWQTVVAEMTPAIDFESLYFMIDAYGTSAFLVDDVDLEMKRPDGSFGPVPTVVGETLAYCERWIRLYHGPARKWLAHGRQLHPPRVVCELVDYVENFRGTVVRNVKPAVHAAAWEAADGSRAVCLANATERGQKLVWTWKGVAHRETMGPREMRVVPVE